MISVRLPSGRSILVPAADLTGQDGATARTTGFDDVTGYTDVTFPIDFRDLAETAAEIGEVVRAAAVKARPTTVRAEVTVGIDLKTGKIAAMFVEGQGKVALTLELEWERPAETAQ